MTPRGRNRTVSIVNRADALESLPQSYAAAIRLRDAGHGSGEIALRLRIAPEAVTSALELAEAKLARLLEVDESEADRRTGTQ
jgi:DNA-directed RNA polymerase specialized sigma24 family protein